MTAKTSSELTRRALRFQQSPDCLLYVFTLTASQILQIADISRVSRDQSGDLIGYQRPEVRQHIQEIADYLNGDQVIFPNPIIIALPSSVKFTNGRGIGVPADHSDQGRIHIPLPAPGAPKVGWIVDGQQRALALARAKCKDLAVPVNAFVTDSIDIQRDQFLRINNTKQLPRGLVTEVPPTISSPLPPRLALRKMPSELCNLLNSDEQSPFNGLIKRSSTSAELKRQTTITDTSIINLLDESLTQPSGCLFPFRNITTGETDFAGIWQVLLTYWSAVRDTFPDAWGKPPSQSRLMHGAGLRAMGRLMDRIMSTVDPRQKSASKQVLEDLALVAPYCHWTSGVWDELDMRWNDVQNVGRHTNQLSSYLIRIYVQAKAGQAVKMEFFFPDSQDQVDPSFDFLTEERSIYRVRQRDDRYAHEALTVPPFDGFLVSKTIVDGLPGAAGKYTIAQRHRLYRVGIREFFRLDEAPGGRLTTMGDCGAFTYVRDDVPPYTPDEVIDFYSECGFDLGISVDHVILGYDPAADHDDHHPQASTWQGRQALTLELAEQFLDRCRARTVDFEPLGVAQGWSPASYSFAVRALQKMGYRRIALGGMVPLKTNEILACLKAIEKIRRRDAQLHLLGITRCEHVELFATFGVTSFDSTSPFRQSFKDDHDNYYVLDRNYTALRVPQVDGNPKLRGRIRAGQVRQDTALKLERECLVALRRFDAGELKVPTVLKALRAYDAFCDDSRKDRTDDYRETLEDRPWQSCPCGICEQVGIDIAMFRGSERNKRRGFHNLYVFSQRLRRELETERSMTPRTTSRRPTAKAVRGAKEIRVPALEVQQGPNRKLYSFAIDGKQLPLFTTVSRVHRDDNSQIRGYQRPEVLTHIASIRRYLESDEPMIPNALVVAFDKRVTFEPGSPRARNETVCTGTLVIPIDPDTSEEDKPGWVVDGQQRCAAIREARIDSFPICVTAFITDSDAEQRSQFILVNSTKPLPKGLIHELLPTTTGTLPTALQLRRFPAGLVDRLNYDTGSPLAGMIHTPTTPTGVIKDNSILRMIENSLSDGALYRFRDPATGEGDAEAMLTLIKEYWSAVRDLFPEAWGQPPRRSRLMHGVGIVSMGFLMDAIVDRHWRSQVPTVYEFAVDLLPLREACRWTSGSWELGPDHHRRWNELQNTPRDIQLLTNFLLFEYKERVWGKPKRRVTGPNA